MSLEHFCLNYLSTAMKKHHNQSNLQEKAFNLGLVVSERKPMPIMMSMPSGRQANMILEQHQRGCVLKQQPGGKKKKKKDLTGNDTGFWNLKAHPVWHLFQRGHTSVSFLTVPQTGNQEFKLRSLWRIVIQTNTPCSKISKIKSEPPTLNLTRWYHITLQNDKVSSHSSSTLEVWVYQ